MAEIGLVIHAANFAAIAHKNQRRKDNDKTPYINHPIEVCNLLILAGVSQVDTLCAALLHDTVEDTGTSLDELANKFGLTVSEIVALCSDDKSLSKITRKKIQLEHTIEMAKNPTYVNGIDVHAQAILVKLADKYSNCRGLLTNPPTAWSHAEIIGYATWTYAIVSQVRTTNRYFNGVFSELFDWFGAKWNIDFKNLTADKLNEMLESYYKIIDKSD